MSTTWHPQIDIRVSQDHKISSYTTDLRRAATITVSGHREPGKPRSPRMARPVSMLLDTEVAKHPMILQPISYFNKEDFVFPNRIVMKDDPFVVDNSDGTDSIESSENMTPADDSIREEATPIDDVVTSSQENEHDGTTDLKESGQQPNVVSIPQQQHNTSPSIDRPAIETIPTPKEVLEQARYNEPANAYLLRTPRQRPASVAIMNFPRSGSPPASSKRRSVQFSPTLASESQTISPTPQVPFPTTPTSLSTKEDEINHTPNSMMHRLSRRVSSTPRTSLSHDLTPETPTRTPHRSSTLPTSFIDDSPSIHNIPAPVLAPLPRSDQLASLDRRNSLQARTPPRARSATAPRAAAGAHRTSLQMDRQRFGRIAENDILIEEEDGKETAPMPTKYEYAESSITASPAVDTAIRQDAIPASRPILTTPTSSSESTQQRRKSAYKRLSVIGSRLSPSVKQTDMKTTLPTGVSASSSRERGQKGKDKGCIIM